MATTEKTEGFRVVAFKVERKEWVEVHPGEPSCEGARFVFPSQIWNRLLLRAMRGAFVAQGDSGLRSHGYSWFVDWPGTGENQTGYKMRMFRCCFERTGIRASWGARKTRMLMRYLWGRSNWEEKLVGIFEADVQ